MTRVRLGVNVDHAATLRNARGGRFPDPVRAALTAIEAGADGITAHLREDRRHIRDEDMARLKRAIDKPLNFEMAATDAMLPIVRAIAPHAVCLVPERRSERTTEGGLDVIEGAAHLRDYIAELRHVGARVSLFIEPDPTAVAAARDLGAPVVELHTGAFCLAAEAGDVARADAEYDRLLRAARRARAAGLECHAGHGLDYATAERLAACTDIVEFNIGHFLMGEALFVGLNEAIRRMRAAMDAGRAVSGRAVSGHGA